MRSERQQASTTAYPNLQTTSNGMVVLFIAPAEGTVVHESTGMHHIGMHSKSWAMDGFKPFCDTITLSN